MAVTGLLLFGFVFVHMLGNLQIFLGQDALNDYAKHLADLPALLWPARVVLLSLLLLHIGTAISLSFENRRARPVRYVRETTIQASYASRTMMMSGVIVFLFIVYHILHFTLGRVQPQFYGHLDAHGHKDVYSMVVLGFQNVFVSASYIVAMAALCLHLSHGFQSLFQSLGLRDEKSGPCLTKLSRALALLIFIGNSSIPVAILLGLVHMPKGGA